MPAAHPPEFRRRALDLLAQGNPVEIEILKRASAYFAKRERAPKIGFRLVHELAADGIPVAVACRSLNVSKSDYYEWAGRALSVRAVADAELTTTIRRIHADSRQT